MSDDFFRAPFGLFGHVSPFEAVTHPGVAEAMSRAAQIRLGASLLAVVPLIAEAWQRRDWVTLGYPSWDVYIAAELGIGRMKRRAADDSRSVYFIQPVTGGLIKIGVAGDPEARLAEIQGMSPVPLHIIGRIPGVGAAGETTLHKRFAGARRHGEWFAPTPELLAYIAAQAGGAA